MARQFVESGLGEDGETTGPSRTRWRTLARGALFADLKAASEVGSGNGERASILYRLREVGTGLVRTGSAGQDCPALLTPIQY